MGGVLIVLILSWQRYGIEDNFGQSWIHAIYMDTIHVNADTLMDVVFTGSDATPAAYPIFGIR